MQYTSDKPQKCHKTKLETHVIHYFEIYIQYQIAHDKLP